MNEYKIIINGKANVVKSYGKCETAIRSIMCGYSYNTLFIVISKDNSNTSYFRSVSFNGGMDLIELNYNTL